MNWTNGKRGRETDREIAESNKSEQSIVEFFFRAENEEKNKLIMNHLNKWNGRWNSNWAQRQNTKQTNKQLTNSWNRHTHSYTHRDYRAQKNENKQTYDVKNI